MPIIIPSKQIYDISHSLLPQNKLRGFEIELQKPRTEQFTWRDVQSETVDVSNIATFPADPASGSTTPLDLENYTILQGAASNNYQSFVAIRPIYYNMEIYVPITDTYLSFDKVFRVTVSTDVQEVRRSITVYLNNPSTNPTISSIVIDSKSSDFGIIEGVDLPSGGTIGYNEGSPVSWKIDSDAITSTSSGGQGWSNVYDDDGNIIGRKINAKIYCGLSKFEAVKLLPLSASFYDGLREYRPKSITVTVRGENMQLVFEKKIELVESDTNTTGEVVRLTNNLFAQPYDVLNPETTTNPYLTTKAKSLLGFYQNGKETAKVLCSIGEYRDDSENLVISANSSEKMLFEHYDTVVPMVRNGYGEDEPMSYTANGFAKTFDVVGVKLFSDGAVWQELTLRESGSAIVSVDLAPPTISISGDTLTITNNDARATRFDIFADGRSVATTENLTFDLADLALNYEATYTITVRASAENYNESVDSNTALYKKYHQLDIPELSISNGIITIVDISGYAEYYDIYVNGEYKAYTTSTTYNLANLGLPSGTYSITVVAKSADRPESEQSEAVTYTVVAKLNAPTITLSGNTLTVTDQSGLAEEFDIYVDGTVKATIS